MLRCGRALGSALPSRYSKCLPRGSERLRGPCRPFLARRRRPRVIRRASSSTDVRCPKVLARPRPLHPRDPLDTRHRFPSRSACRLDVGRATHHRSAPVRPLPSNDSDSCSSVDECRRSHRLSNKAVESTHRTISDSLRPVASGKTEDERDVCSTSSLRP